MNESAADVYEVVLDEVGGPKKWFRSAATLIFGALSMGSGVMNPGGMIISVVRRSDGEELFRHIEDWGDDEGHLLDGIQKDLETMTALEFAHRWTN